MAKNSKGSFLDDFQKQTKGLNNLSEQTPEETAKVDEVKEEVKETVESTKNVEQKKVEEKSEVVEKETETNSGIKINLNLRVEPRTARKQICLTPSLAKTAEKFCKKNNISFNELVNQLLDIYFNQQN